MAARRPVVLVAGATGGIGKLIVDKLLRSGDFVVRAMVRNVATARTTFASAGGGAQSSASGSGSKSGSGSGSGSGSADSGLHSDLSLLRGDVTEAGDEGANALDAALDGVDAVISALGARFSPFASAGGSPKTVDFEGICNLVNACVRKNVRRVVLVSSTSVTKDWNILNLFGGYAKYKFMGENHMRRTNINYVVVRPAGLQDKEGGLEVEYAQGDDMRGRSVTRDDSARACIASLRTILKATPLDDDLPDEAVVRLTFEMATAKSGKPGVRLSSDKDEAWDAVVERLTPDPPMGSD